MTSLTPKQAVLLDFIRAEITATGVAPSLAEMCRHLGCKSPGRIHCLLKGLESRGAIRREFKKARAITLVEPADMDAISAFKERLIAEVSEADPMSVSQMIQIIKEAA